MSLTQVSKSDDLIFEVSEPTKPTKPVLTIVKTDAPQPKPQAVDVYENPTKALDRITNEMLGTAVSTSTDPVIFNLTEHGYSLRFVKLFGASVRYNATQNAWMRWDEKRWDADAKGDALQKMTQTAKFMQDQEAASMDVLSAVSGDYYAMKAKEIREAGLKLEKHGTAQSALKYAQTHPTIATKEGEYDTQPKVFNCASGIVDLATGTVKPHDPAELHSQFSPVELAPEGAPCPRWMHFLAQITCGDADLVQYLQTLTGYFLSGETNRQEFYVFHGSGSNGKSTFIETIAKMLGDYAINADRKTFYVKYQGGGIPNDIAMLRKSRFITCMEGEEGDQIDEGLIKSFTGGDSITARFLHGEFFQFKPVGKVVLVSNYKPIIKSDGYGIWRRVRMIPFLATFDESQKDPELPAKLAAELPAILRWAVEGAKRWMREGIKEPQCVLDAIKSYKEELDYVQQFMDDRCDIGDAHSCTALELHAAFEQWMKEQGHKFNYGGVKGLKQKMMTKGFECKRMTAGVRWNRIKPNLKKVAIGIEESNVFSTPRQAMSFDIDLD